MTTDTRRRHNSGGTTDAPTPYRRGHYRLGTDAEGFMHHFDARAGHIHRIDTDTGARERVETLDGKTLADWYDFVQAAVGWTEWTHADVAAAFLATGGRR